MESCCLPASSSTQRNFIVVWFDDLTLVIDDNVRKIITELEHFVGTLTIFSDLNKCVEYVNNIKDLQILLIVGESNGAQVVRRVRHASKLRSIYILCSNQSIHPPWATACKPVRCVFVDSTSICERIKMDTGDNSITWNIIDTSSIPSPTSTNLNKQEVQFMYIQLLKNILTEMSYSHDHMNNLIEFFRKNRPIDIKKIEEFRDNATEMPVWCYTTYAFLYETLNAALRTCDVQILHTMGIFIKALHQEIVEMHKTITEPKTLKLYRGQIIPTAAFEKIQKNKGRLMSINNFLSTTSFKNVALMFAAKAPSDHTHTSVVFEITINQSMPTSVSYANIQSLSQYIDEEEYLFTMGSVFRIESVKQDDGNATWYVYLTLTTDQDPELTLLTKHLRSSLKEPNLISLCGLIFHMGEYEKVVEICEAGIKTSNDILDMYALHQILGYAYLKIGHHQQALTTLELALHYSRQIPGGREGSLSVYYTKSVILLQEGKLDLALTNIETAMQNEHKYSNPQYHQETLIMCSLLMGIIFCRQGRLSDAISCHTKAYNMAKEYLPSTHPTISDCLNQLATTYMLDGQTDEAFLCMQESVKIQQDSMLPEHISSIAAQTLHDVLQRPQDQCSICESYTEYPITNLLKRKSDAKQTPMELLYQSGIHMKKNEIDDALSVMDQYFSIQRENNPLLQSPELIIAYSIKGMCHWNKKNLPEALQNFKQAYEIANQHLKQANPMRMIILLNIADIHAEQGNYDEALIIVNQSKDLYPDKLQKIAKGFNHNPLNQIALTFKSRGLDHFENKEYEEAVTRLQNCLEIQRKCLPWDHPELADTYHAIATVLFDRDNYSDALINYQNAQNIWEKCLSPNHPKLARNWNGVRLAHSMLQQYDGALFASHKYLEILKNTSPLDYPKLANTYQWIGRIFYMQLKFLDAIHNYRWALYIRVNHMSPMDPEIAKIWVLLEEAYLSVQRCYPALYAFNQALDIQISSLPPLPPDYLDLAKAKPFIDQISHQPNNFSDAPFNSQAAFDNRLKDTSVSNLDIANNFMAIGNDYKSLGQHNQCLFAFNQCLQIQRNVLPSDHIDIATTHQRIAHIYYKTGQYEEALLNLQTCLTIQMDSLSSDHLDIADTHSLIANALEKLDSPSDALKHYQCALDIQRRHLPTTGLKVINSLRQLGSIYLKLHRDDDLLPALNECLTIQRNVLPSNHIDIAVSHKLIGLFFYEKRQYEEALLNFQICLTIQMDSLSSDHLDIADTHSSIGDALKKLNIPSDALTHYQCALDIQRRHLPTTGLKVIDSLKQLGSIYCDLRRYKDALFVLNQCQEIQLNVLPPDHIDIARLHELIESVCDLVGEG